MEEVSSDEGSVSVTGSSVGPGASTMLAGGADAGRAGLPVKHVKRLGFGGLELEPEYLVDRLKHECASLAMPCQAHEVRVQGAEVMRMEVCSGGARGSCSAVPNGSSSSLSAAGVGGVSRAGEGLRALVHVIPEDADGTYSISLMRLVGDTFEFHALYRSLRERLQDLTTPAAPLAAQS